MSTLSNLTPSQDLIAQDPHRFRVVVCGRKWGKSTLATFEMLAVAVHKEANIAYFATTYGEARDIIWNRLKELCKPAIISANETNLELTIRNNSGTTSHIRLRGWETIETARGLEFDFIVLDEVQNYRNFWALWQEVLRPTLGPRQGSALFIGTPKGYNALFDLYNLENDPQRGQHFRSFRFTSYDNPHINKDEIDQAKLELSDIKFAQEYLAEFKKTEGLVYPMFDRKLSTFDMDKRDYLLMRYKDATTYGGVDFGWTNPTAIIKVIKDQDDNFYVVDEWVHTGKTNAEMIEYAKTMGITLFYPDPAEPDRIKEMERAGMSIRAVNKDIDKGIDCVRNLLKNKKLFVYEGCRNTIAEFETYSYEDNKSDRNDKEKPIDVANHCMDALRYALFMLSTTLQRFKAPVHYAQGMHATIPVVLQSSSDVSHETKIKFHKSSQNPPAGSYKAKEKSF